MSIDARYVELMHAEIDGLNTERESAELREVVARDPEIRKSFTELQELADTLARVEPVDPPPDLKDRVLGALPAGSPGHTGSFRPQRDVRLRASVALRYAYPFAAGLILGIVGYYVVSGDTSGTVPPDPSDIVGAMTAHEPAPDAGTVPGVEFDVAGIAGTARVGRVESGFSVEFDLDARVPVEVVLSYDTRDVGFRGLTQDLGEVQALEVAGGTITWAQQGHHRLAVLLAARTEAPATLDLRFLVSGGLLHSDRLELPGLH